MRFLPHAHRISLLSPAPVSHIFHNCRPSMPRKQKTALVPTPIKQSHEAMVVSYRPQTLHDTIHTVLPGEVLPAIPSYLEFIAVRLFVFQLTYFNSQPYEEADLPPVPREHSLDISTHSLTKRLTSDIWHTEFFHRYFNSQPHEEADSNRPYENDDEHISTHSLTKRLTLLSDYFNAIANISTHSLTKRLTDPLGMFIRFVIFQLTASRRGWRPLTLMLKGFWLFQLTASRRGWQLFLERHILHEWISTHSLTKRLTTTANAPMIFPSLFQLTASRRGWLFQCIIPSSVVHFNSQPHEEADPTFSVRFLWQREFQLTASRRGWPSCTATM